MLLITPPFTQLNTPYPATAYLKGFLNTLGRQSHQYDLGIELILKLFSADGLGRVFDEVEKVEMELSENAYRILLNRNRYIATVDSVISFLQNRNQTFAHAICGRNLLPEAVRFVVDVDFDYMFGSMGLYDRARYLATLYLEDLADFISETIDSDFGFSRYAERIARAATTFDKLHAQLQTKDTLITQLIEELLVQQLTAIQPKIVCLTAPFPGNILSAFKCGQIVKQHFPQIKVILGGGFANTELRALSDCRVFEFVDYVTLDDGEAPLQQLIGLLEAKHGTDMLLRSYTLVDGKVAYFSNDAIMDVSHANVGTPDYSDLKLDKYLSVIDVLNPMHRLWSDGRWNKMTIAHGCYWAKCSFCDISLDYIKRYDAVSAAILCDRMEAIMQQTGENGFHFVDEAAPPVLMRDLALEILNRGLAVVWWTNVRFEKRFDAPLCQLLKASGCIAVSGGLEVASDRLLQKMNKGVTVEQVARVAKAFTDEGIMVHAYLMYGFPTQTKQETIDSLELVRQLFAAGVVHSGFWHQFALTAHSQVGLFPDAFDIRITGPKHRGFARNDLFYGEASGIDHAMFSEGLSHSLYNYMMGVAMDEPLSYWFDFSIPEPSVSPDFIEKALAEKPIPSLSDHQKVVWLGGHFIDVIEPRQTKKKKHNPNAQAYTEIYISGQQQSYSVFFEINLAKWIVTILEKAGAQKLGKYSLKAMKTDFEVAGLHNFDAVVKSESFQFLIQKGLLIL